MLQNVTLVHYINASMLLLSDEQKVTSYNIRPIHDKRGSESS